MSALMRDESPLWDRDEMAHQVSVVIVDHFADQLKALGPIWLRFEPRRWLWVVAPIGVLIVGAPAELLRSLVAVVVAVGVACALNWQTAVDAHRTRSAAFVENLAAEVAEDLIVQLSPRTISDVAEGRFRPATERSILNAAEKKAHDLTRTASVGFQ